MTFPMATLPTDHLLAWAIIILATCGVIVRPFHLPEAIWAVAGAALLVLLRLLPVNDAISGMRRGVDVYLFLTGMMLIAELARREGFFDWLAALAVEHARGSPQRLFLLVYAVGTLVTAFLSNDATAIVLTPAVYAATRAAGATPLPYLFVCAFIANAASFVLPISNPANLVVYGGAHAASCSTGCGSSRCRRSRPSSSPGSCCAGAAPRARRGASRAQGADAAAPAAPAARSAGHRGDRRWRWSTASALDVPLGLPTFLCGVVTAAAVLALARARRGRSSATSHGACCRWSQACS